MAIKIKNLEQFKDVYSDKPYFYKDLALDISTANIVTPTKEFLLPQSYSILLKYFLHVSLMYSVI